MTDNTTALALRPTGYLAPPSEDEFRGMIFMAKQLAEVSGFVPAHFFKQPNKILAAMLYGRDLGITPTNALQHIIVIDGKATADAQLIGMLVRRAGHRLEDKTTEQQSTVTITRGDDGTSHVFTFTMQDAARAGLVRAGSAWQKYPQAMLFARALTGCARKGAQDALMGVAYVPEEMGVEVAPDGGFTGEIPITQASPETVAALEAATVAPQQQPEGEPSQGTGAEASPAPAPPTAAPAAPERSARSVGPRAKRQNVVQAPTTGKVAPEVPAAPVAQAEPVPNQPAPPDLAEDAIPADDGLGPQRELVRQVAAELAHVNAVLRNALEHALKGEPLEVVPPKDPNPTADAGIKARIEIDWPGKALATLGPAELQGLLERFDMSLNKKRAIMTERGIAE